MPGVNISGDATGMVTCAVLLLSRITNMHA